MRLLRKNLQKMKYATQGDMKPIYETDENGNTKYYNGNPIETGEYQLTYSNSEDMYGNIAFSSGEAEAQEFGISVSDYDCSLITPKDAYSITETTLIWHESDVGYTSNGAIDPKSADYTVAAVKPSLNYSKYLLKRVTK